MASFDVVSLFTNVPIGLAVDVVEKRLLDDCTLGSRTALLVEDIVILLRFCLNQTYFTFDNVVYHQIEGCPMGSPVSVTVANLVMEHVEKLVVNSLSFPLKMYCRYVDDTFVILKKVNLHTFHLALNSIHTAIQFTCETERDGVLPFLDVLVRRVGGGAVETEVYRKPCDSGNVLCFDSHHPAEHKRAVVRTLLSRCDVLSSNDDLRSRELTRISTSLGRRHYPGSFISDARKRMQQCRVDTGGKGKPTVCIPYVRGTSDSIRRALTPLGIRTVFKPAYTLAKAFSKPKDVTPANAQTGVVYKVNCVDCDATYIGETGRRRSTRLKEHR
ncbi:unnamed protein product, partial [Ixodes persulcatus]